MRRTACSATVLLLLVLAPAPAAPVPRDDTAPLLFGCWRLECVCPKSAPHSRVDFSFGIYEELEFSPDNTLRRRTVTGVGTAPLSSGTFGVRRNVITCTERMQIGGHSQRLSLAILELTADRLVLQEVAREGVTEKASGDIWVFRRGPKPVAPGAVISTAGLSQPDSK